MAAVVVKNAKQVIDAINDTVDDYEKAAKYGISMAALAIERQAKKNASTGVHGRGEPHIPGTGPGPNRVTGYLVNSIITEVREGFGTYTATVGPTAAYARALELGNPRWKSGVKYPFLFPAVTDLAKSGNLNRIFNNAVRSRLRG